MRIITTAFLAGALIATAGCTSAVSHDISDAGVAGTVVFPDPEHDLVLKGGTFPNVESLHTVRPGVTKEQLYQLLGRPHFREGFHGVREWDYLFHFNTPQGQRTCQYKVIFDKDYRGQSFHWKPEDCARVMDALVSTQTN